MKLKEFREDYDLARIRYYTPVAFNSLKLPIQFIIYAAEEASVVNKKGFEWNEEFISFLYEKYNEVENELTNENVREIGNAYGKLFKDS